MNKIYVPTSSPEDWKKLLAHSEKHWKKGYSAMELAKCWENAKEWPDCINSIFKKSHHVVFHMLELLFAYPEYRVSLPGANIGQSQNDLYVIAKSGLGLISIMIEAKVDESFDKTIAEWLKNASPGKKERYSYLCSKLGVTLSLQDEMKIRYQLLHRTVSAIIEARKLEQNML